MSNVVIRDIAHHAELAREEMSAVRGGMSVGFPLISSDSFHLSNEAQQFTQQSQNTLTNTGVNVAFAQKLGATVDPHQKSSNSNQVNVYSPYAYAS